MIIVRVSWQRMERLGLLRWVSARVSHAKKRILRKVNRSAPKKEFHNNFSGFIFSYGFVLSQKRRKRFTSRHCHPKKYGTAGLSRESFSPKTLDWIVDTMRYPVHIKVDYATNYPPTAKLVFHSVTDLVIFRLHYPEIFL